MDNFKDDTEHLGIDHLQSLLRLNSINFNTAKAASLPLPLGNSLIYAPSEDVAASKDSPLLTIPTSQILCYQSVISATKNNSKLAGLIQKLEEEGWLNRQNPRTALILGLALAFRGIHVGGFWTSYVKFLPTEVPLPTLWKEEERDALRGTSLEYAVKAKLNALTREYLELCALTKDSEIFGTKGAENDALQFEEDEEDQISVNMFSFRFYLHLDSLVRSRSLELPDFGTSLVPVLDLANHSHNANAYYVLDKENSIISLVESGENTLKEGDEIRINYGAEKPPAEFLFSYGFIDDTAVVESQIVPLFLGADEPQAKAKQQFLKKMPTVKFYKHKEKEKTEVRWKSDAVWTLSLNYPDDPLEFLSAATVTGDVTTEASFDGKPMTILEDLQPLLEKASNGLWPVYRLRAVSRILMATEDVLNDLVEAENAYSQNCEAEPTEKAELAHKLRLLEGEFLSEALQSLTTERDELLKGPVVLKYLEEMSKISNKEESEDEEEDFT